MKEVLISILVSLLKAFLPALVNKLTTETAEDGAPAVDLRDRLRDKIRQTWPAAMVALVLILPACQPRSIYVPDGTPIRLRETIKGAAVWVLDKDRVQTATTMDIPEGWYCLPMPEKDDADDSARDQGR